jgi:hypothetical protein
VVALAPAIPAIRKVAFMGGDGNCAGFRLCKLRGVTGSYSGFAVGNIALGLGEDHSFCFGWFEQCTVAGCPALSTLVKISLEFSSVYLIGFCNRKPGAVAEAEAATAIGNISLVLGNC